MNNLLALIAFALFLGFLGILVVEVPRLDLFGVVAVSVALAAWDLVRSLRGGVSNK